MTSIDPVRGPEMLPRFAPLVGELLPLPHETMVLRSRNGRLLELPRGACPTSGQRLVGGFIEAYYISMGVHTRTFSTRLRTADPGLDLRCDVDVELEVENCLLLVQHRREDLNERLGNWCREHADRITAKHRLAATPDAGQELTTLGEHVADTLRTTVRQPDIAGLRLRELRVRLDYADEEIVAKESDTRLREMLRVGLMHDLNEKYEPIFGPEITKVLLLLTDGQTDQMSEVIKQILKRAGLADTTIIDVYKALVTGSKLEPHILMRLTQYLNMRIQQPDGTLDDFAADLMEGRVDLALEADEDDADDD